MVKFRFPDIGEGVHEGKIFEVLVKLNAKIKEGDSLFSVETDKITTDIPSPVSGIIKKINIKKEQIVKVGELIFEIDDGKKQVIEIGEAKQQKKSASVVGEVQESQAVLKSPSATNSAKGASSSINQLQAEKNIQLTSPINMNNLGNIGPVLATPSARKLAKELNIDLNLIQGSGPNNRILISDIQQVSLIQTDVSNQKPIKIQKAKLSFANGISVEKMTPTRIAISNAMTKAKSSIPETTLMLEVNVSELVKLRASLKEEYLTEKIKLTYLPFVIKAVTYAISEIPVLNSKIDLTKKEVQYFENCNIGLAIDTDYGLVVPNIKQAQKLSIKQLAINISNLALKAKEKKLTIDEIRNGTFSITNYGSVGIKFATPVINFPETAILGVGAIEERVVFDKQKQGLVMHESYLPLSLTIDHRIIDGADGGRFLQRIKEFLNSPSFLLK